MMFDMSSNTYNVISQNHCRYNNVLPQTILFYYMWSIVPIQFIYYSVISTIINTYTNDVYSNDIVINKYMV